MSGWQQRKAVGDAHEQYVAEELTLRGWEVNAWGQGVLTRSVRGALRRTDSSLRWTPDLVAARGEIVALIDCKSRMTSGASDRHAVERAAVKAHLQLAAWTDLPVYYVFDDLGVLTPHDVLMAGRLGPHTRVGSGAPYYLIGTQLDRRFDDIFGPHERLAQFHAAA
ncbi:hypothetical protein PYK79_10825 [Streptomyces sp. ID05-04B]|uniref:hypothetical protein n=1 Tax=Streptomyces sp. ID05-04B TaxID=3028661 RepID=UPI0029C51D86|nr:hypothetical protein [Streptomyces sp. ID05-04B]MDX5563746.1 hypothetical protein [Streptomyces sp. ID05-04B]